MAADGTPAPSFMARYGERLVDSGFHVIPIIPGLKAPGLFQKSHWVGYHDWTKHCSRATTHFELKIWAPWPECGIGVACGNVVPLDIDVLDGDVAIRIEQLARDRLGDTPAVRVGLAPKRLLVYRTTKPFPSIKHHPLEFLGKGAQFVAYAIHPDTGQPYHWPHDGLADLDLSSLPLITEDMAHAFINEAIKLVPVALRQKRLGSPRSAEFFHGSGGDLRGTPEAVTAAMAWIPNDDLDWDSWVAIGLALKAAIGEAGAIIWSAWSRTNSKSGSSGKPNTPEKLWRGFNPHSIGAGTIYRYAMDNGWVPPPGMILNGIEADRLAEMGDVHPAAELLGKLNGGSGHEVVDDEPGNGVDHEAEEVAPSTFAQDLIVAKCDGLLADIVAWMTSTAIYPQPFLALGAAIAAIGTCAGRRFAGPMDTRTNIYCIGIAESGSGKEHQLTCLNNLFFAADLIELFAGEDVSSGVAVESTLSQYAVQLFQIDEFGHFLKSIMNPRAVNSHRRDILVKLTKYTGAATRLVKGTEYANKKERARVDVHQPCVCLYGTTISAPLWEAFGYGAVNDGSIARMLFFKTSQNSPRPRRPEVSARDVPDVIVDAMRRVVAGVAGAGDEANPVGFSSNKAAMLDGRYPPVLTNVDFNDDASALADTLMNEQADLKLEHQQSGFLPVVARWLEHIHRLALIRAISRDQLAPTITANDLAWARALVDHCIGILTADADRYLADTEHEAALKRVVDVLRRHGCMTGREFSRRTQFLSRRTRIDIVSQLVESGLVSYTRTVNLVGAPSYTVELVRK
jgi:hypothetical protein